MSVTIEKLVGTPALRQTLPGLVAQTVHDLNNHLATILGKAELALMLEDPARWRRGLDEVMQAAQRARLAVSDLQCLLVWSEPGHGSVPFTDIASMALRFTARRLDQQRVRVTLVAGDAPPVTSHAADLTLALVHLFAAALAQGPADGGTWTLGASSATTANQWGVELRLADRNWPAETGRLAERALRLGEFAPDPLGRALECLAPLEPTVEVAGPALRITFGN